MTRKRHLGIIALSVLSLSLSGCGSTFPELTQTEYEQTVEYAVGLLMKYSNNGQEKLTYVNAKEVEKQRAKEAEKEAEKAAEKEEKNTQTTQTASATVPATTPATTTGNGSDVSNEDNSAQMTSEGQAEASQQDTAPSQDPSAIVLSSDETQEIADDIFISYAGYSVSSSFPESSKSYVINAEKGKKLLVLRFDLYNGSDTAKSVNILKKNLLFQILINDKNIGYSSVTVLPNDLTSYVGTIESRAHESLVVLAEIKESDASAITSLGLIVSMDGMDQTVNLK